MSKRFLKQIIEHNGKLYQVTNWVSVFSQPDVSLASINPITNNYDSSTRSAPPASEDYISQPMHYYPHSRKIFLGRLYKYVEEIEYLAAKDFKDDPVPKLPEDYDDSKIMVDPAFYEYERTIRTHLLASLGILVGFKNRMQNNSEVVFLPFYNQYNLFKHNLELGNKISTLNNSNPPSSSNSSNLTTNNATHEKIALKLRDTVEGKKRRIRA